MSEVATNGRALPDAAAVPRPWLAAYPPGVPPTYEYPRVPLTRFLDDAARDFPGRPATWFRGASIEYADLRAQVDRCAAGLAQLGVTKGDRVGIVLPNLPASVVVTFATLRLGAVVVQADVGSTADELAHQLSDAGCSVVVGLAPRVDELRAVAADVACVEHVVVTGIEEWLPLLRRLTFPLVGRARGTYRRIGRSDHVVTLAGLIEDAGPIAEQVPVAARDPAVLQYTGGTTGSSKGVVLTHGNLVANSFQARLWLPDIQAGKERLLSVLPFSHVYGLTMGMLTSMLSAATLVLQAWFDPGETLDIIEETSPTIFPAVPRIYDVLASHPGVAKRDLGSIRACVSGAASLPASVARRFEELTGGARVREGYGLSESSPLTHANPIYGRWRLGSIGLPVTDTVAVVVDPNDPTVVLGRGEVGELAIHGPQVMAGYHNRPAETAEVLRDGWLLTGDLATYDDDGFFAIVDRKKDVIVLPNGHNVYPDEVEAVLRRHPAVAQAAVVGVDDPEHGDWIKGHVVLRGRAAPPVEELDEHCRQHLIGYKVPREIEVRTDLPTTSIGKVLRRRLREEARHRAAAPEQAGP